jgi:hypothetical protein
MRQVKCVSPHGGARYGTNGRGDPVLSATYSGPRQLPANEGGYVTNGVLGRVAVGSTVDAPEAPAFIADGFHFVTSDGKADECTILGPACWCGLHKTAEPDKKVTPASPSATDKKGTE